MYRPMLTQKKPALREVTLWPKKAIPQQEYRFEDTWREIFKQAATKDGVAFLPDYTESVPPWLYNLMY